ncbi:MAG: IclR family transcriptional regulator C-terminal domain-containing protein [Pseudomonadota bacterium]
MVKPQPQGAGQVRSLIRALSILESLAASGGGLSLSELVEETDLPPSTVHRLLTTLESRRFVRTEPSGGPWHIGSAAFFVGSAFARNRDTMTFVRPYLRRLVDMTSETANLFVERDGVAVCIGQIESRHAMRAITAVGGQVALHASGSGKVLLAHMPEDRRQAVLSVPLTAATERTVTDPAKLDKELKGIPKNGYAIDDEENAIGLRCVAAPILNEFGEAAASISVSGPTARITDQRLGSLTETVQRVAAEATRDFGGTLVGR